MALGYTVSMTLVQLSLTFEILDGDWSSDVCSSDLQQQLKLQGPDIRPGPGHPAKHGPDIRPRARKSGDRKSVV